VSEEIVSSHTEKQTEFKRPRSGGYCFEVSFYPGKKKGLFGVSFPANSRWVLN
jgi:hypothetical protein